LGAFAMVGTEKRFEGAKKRDLVGIAGDLLGWKKKACMAENQGRRNGNPTP